MKRVSPCVCRRRRFRRKIKLAGVAFTLMALPSGTCVDMAVRTAINSFFDGVTPVLIDQLETQLTAATEVNETP
jgi:Na+/H+-dicarboxylate symporter